MERDDALRVMDQVIAAGYGCDLRATNVTEDGGAHYTVGVNIAGWNPPGKMTVLTSIAESNGCDAVAVVDSAPQVHAWLTISSPKDRPDQHVEPTD